MRVFCMMMVLMLTACAGKQPTPMQDSPPDVMRYRAMDVPVANVELLDSRENASVPRWIRRDLYHDMLASWAEHRFAVKNDEDMMRIEIIRGTVTPLPAESASYELLKGELVLRMAFYEGGELWPKSDATIKAETQVPYEVDADAMTREKAYNAMLQRLMDMVDAEASQRIYSILPANHLPATLTPNSAPNTDDAAPKPLTQF